MNADENYDFTAPPGFSNDAQKSEEDFFVHKSYKQRLNKRLTFLDRKGVNTKLLFWLLILITVAAFTLFIVFYSYRTFQNTTKLLAQVNELENAFLEVQILTRVKNEAIGSVSTRNYLEQLQGLLGISGKSGEYKDLSLSGDSTKLLKVVEMLVNEPRILIKKLELRSNLGFPILPVSNLPSNIFLDLKTDISVTGSF